MVGYELLVIASSSQDRWCESHQAKVVQSECIFVPMVIYIYRILRVEIFLCPAKSNQIHHNIKQAILKLSINKNIV
jgi:hypothetical protein